MDSKIVLTALAILSVAVGVYQAVAFYYGHLASPGFQGVWAIAFVLLLASWLQLDARKYRHVSRPFDFGFLVLLFWPLYLPCYLVRTRRALGIVWLVGFGCLFYLGYLLQVLVYISR